jgi:hypothetical protein
MNPMQQTIQRYQVPDEVGTFSIRMPPHCRVLGLHGTKLVVLGIHDDPERFVDKRFIAVGDGDGADHCGNHRYIGTQSREYPGVGAWYQHVFEELPPPDLSDFMGPV